jgi:hypothetical protein
LKKEKISNCILLPNQALPPKSNPWRVNPPNKTAGKQADGVSVGAINMANRGFVFNNLIGSVNLFPWVHFDNLSRCSLVAIR